MKNLILLLFSCIFIVSCVSVKRYNQRLETPIAADQLQADVDFAYQKLQKFHPNLYWYISKDSLDKEFNDVKKSITNPLKPREFYEKLEPVIAHIKEGHLRLVHPAKRYTKKELKQLEKQKGLFSRMNYTLENDKIFVLDNADNYENIKIGTEILKINQHPVKEYLDRYKKYINSDGENTTYQKYSLSRRWPLFFTLEHGILDSIEIQTKYANAIKDFYIHREKITQKQKKTEEKKTKKIAKTQNGKTKDYNVSTKSYNRDLQFLTKDSTVAYMKIKTFSGTYSKKFYKQSFALLKKSNTEYLILDVRDNLGGSLSEIHNLYSYLSKEKFQFINDIEVTSSSSMYHANYIGTLPTLVKPIAIITYPIYFIGTAFSNKKKDGKHYLRNNTIFTVKNQKKDAFEGKIYVLINGSSFSAASILPSKLKYEKRAFLVGEETGGANDGTVAGRYSTKKLPHSKLELPIGLMLIQPHIEFTQTKKGVVPDKEIIPTLDEILQKKDIQLNWVKLDIEKDKTVKK